MSHGTFFGDRPCECRASITGEMVATGLATDAVVFRRAGSTNSNEVGAVRIVSEPETPDIHP